MVEMEIWMERGRYGESERGRGGERGKRERRER